MFELPLILRYIHFMKKLQFSVEIKAQKEQVWKTLWTDKTFRDWANNIDEGMYLLGEMKEGNEVQFVSPLSGYGVTSLIEKLDPNEYMLFRHLADTEDHGQKERENEWTGGQESYSLKEHKGCTTLIVELDAPMEQVETFEQRMPKALDRVKTLAEKKN
jgi:uncharacterized protein YndB with AHSA1/START domain